MQRLSVSITSLAELMELERRIAQEVMRHPLDRLILALRAVQTYDHTTGRRGIPDHVIGTATRFALRYGVPGALTDSSGPLLRSKLDPLLQLTGDFAHADPVAWERSVPNSNLSIMLRHAGNQFPYAARPSGSWGRAEIMFNELPDIVRRKKIPDFDFHRQFHELTGVSVADFIDIGYVIYTAARSDNQLGFTRGYFEKARTDGMTIGGDAIVRQVMCHFAADSETHVKRTIEYQQSDRNFAAYDFNSLFIFPLIRPWPLKGDEEVDLDRMIAPLPELILFRITSGIYYQMRDRWRRPFDDFFGHLLEAYVGHLLRSFVAPTNLISEEEIRAKYSTSAGRAPDWIVIDGKTAIMIEVKVARVHREVYAKGDEAKLNESLHAIRDGIRQLFEFRMAVAEKRPGLERLHRCKKCVSVLVTLEPTYLGTSVPFKELLRESLDPELRSMEYAMISLDALEWFATHLSAGQIDIASAFRSAMKVNPVNVVESMAKQSGRTFKDSLLCRKEQELHRRIGVPPL